MATSSISLSASPARHSLMMQVDVGTATAQLRRNIGLFSANYSSAKAITNSYLELQPGESITGPMTSGLFIKTNKVLTFYAERPNPDPPISYVINQLSFVDYEITTFTITNSTLDLAIVQLSYASIVPQLNENPITAPVLTVNGQAPDASGNVVVDTGVMTVNSIVPGSQGIPGDVNVTDEGTYQN